MIVGVFTYWQVIVAYLVLMFTLPVIFFFASFDKRPPKIKRKVVADKSEKPEQRSENQQQRNEDQKQFTPYSVPMGLYSVPVGLYSDPMGLYSVPVAIFPIIGYIAFDMTLCPAQGGPFV